MNEGGGDAEMVSEKLLGLVREAIAVSGFSDTQVYYNVDHLSFVIPQIENCTCPGGLFCNPQVILYKMTLHYYS